MMRNRAPRRHPSRRHGPRLGARAGVPRARQGHVAGGLTVDPIGATSPTGRSRPTTCSSTGQARTPARRAHEDRTPSGVRGRPARPLSGRRRGSCAGDRDRDIERAVAEAAPAGRGPRSGAARPPAPAPPTRSPASCAAAGVLPLLVLHLLDAGPSYGNQLIEQIGELTRRAPEREPEHDVSAAARARAAGARRGRLGAPGASLAALLRDHARRRGRARAPAPGRSPRAWTRSPRSDRASSACEVVAP